MSKILLLPGIGDIYWVAVTLESFCKVHNLGKPDVYIWDIDGRRRSIEFVERIPFVNSKGYWDYPHKAVPNFSESYRTGENCVFPDFLGFDYYIAFNGWLQAGKAIDGAIPGVRTNWDFQLGRTDEDIMAERELHVKFPKGYIVAHLSGYGMFKHWIRKWGAEGCAELCEKVYKLTGLPVLLTGCEWDAPFADRVFRRIRNKAAKIYNYCTQTPPDQFYGMLHGASGVIGWCGGNTILATHLKVPTLMLWSEVYFKDPAFYNHACSPESLGNWYEPHVIEHVTPVQMAEAFKALLEKNNV